MNKLIIFDNSTISDIQGFCLWDSPGTTIEPYFGPAADYLDLVLSAPGGKVCRRIERKMVPVESLSLRWGLYKNRNEMR